MCSPGKLEEVYPVRSWCVSGLVTYFHPVCYCEWWEGREEDAKWDLRSFHSVMLSNHRFGYLHRHRTPSIEPNSTLFSNCLFTMRPICPEVSVFLCRMMLMMVLCLFSCCLMLCVLQCKKNLITNPWGQRPSAGPLNDAAPASGCLVGGHIVEFNPFNLIWCSTVCIVLYCLIQTQLFLMLHFVCTVCTVTLFDVVSKFGTISHRGEGLVCRGRLRPCPGGPRGREFLVSPVCLLNHSMSSN